MNWYKRSSIPDSSAYGIFEYEAFSDKKIADALVQHKTGHRTESHPEEPDPKDQLWNIFYIKLPAEQVQQTISMMQKGMSDGWYSLLWDSKNIYVIFNNGVRTIANQSTGAIPSFDDKEISKISDLAKSNGLDDKYMNQYLRSGIGDFEKHLSKEQP